jgi:hypothetical protein
MSVRSVGQSVDSDTAGTEVVAERQDGGTQFNVQYIGSAMSGHY